MEILSPMSKLPDTPLDKVMALIEEKEALIQRMMLETQKITYDILRWQKSQDIEWVRWWKDELGIQKREHILYYLETLDRELGKLVILEVFAPFFIKPWNNTSGFDPVHFCIVERSYDKALLTQPDRLRMVRATAIGVNRVLSGTKSDEIKEALTMPESSGIVLYEYDYPIKETRSGSFEFTKERFSSFGWRMRSSMHEISTSIPLGEKVGEVHDQLYSGDVRIHSGNIHGSRNPFFDSERHLFLLKEAKFFLMRDPVDKIFKPFSK